MKNTNPMACTPLSPMPVTRDQMGQHWIHNGAVVMKREAIDLESDRVLYMCPNCGWTWWDSQKHPVVDDRFGAGKRQLSSRDDGGQVV